MSHYLADELSSYLYECELKSDNVETEVEKTILTKSQRKQLKQRKRKNKIENFVSEKYIFSDRKIIRWFFGIIDRIFFERNL